MSSHSSHHPQDVLLAQFSLYVHKGGLKPDSFHFFIGKTGVFCQVIFPNQIEKSYTLKYFNHALQLTVITTHKLFAHSLGTPAIQTNKLAKEMYSNYNKKQNVCPY